MEEVESSLSLPSSSSSSSAAPPPPSTPPPHLLLPEPLVAQLSSLLGAKDLEVVACKERYDPLYGVESSVKHMSDDHRCALEDLLVRSPLGPCLAVVAWRQEEEENEAEEDEETEDFEEEGVGGEIGMGLGEDGGNRSGREGGSGSGHERRGAAGGSAEAAAAGRSDEKALSGFASFRIVVDEVD
jgi:hypothetical protein